MAKPATRILAQLLTTGALLGLLLSSAAVVAGRLDTLEHDIELNVTPSTHRIEARDRVRLTGSGQVSFRLAPSMTIEQLLLDGVPVPVPRRDHEGRIVLDLDGSHQLDVRYSGHFPPAEEEKRPGEVNNGSAVLTPDYGYLPPHVAWYPDFSHAPFSYRLQVALPAGQMAVVPGDPVPETGETEPPRFQRFESTHPVFEIPLFTGPYRMTERLTEDYRIRTYFFAGMDALAEDYLNFSHRYLALFERQVGPYPYDFFYVVAARLPVGLGFTGSTYIGERVLRLPFIKYSSLGHEILHNWWGNGVRVDYARGNWAEGLTTYMADYHFLKQKSDEAARQKRLEWLRDYAALPVTRDYPPREFTSKSHTASQVVGYNKVAFVFHMLKRQLGEERFSRAIGAFWQAYRFQTAAWSDLERQFSTTAATDLQYFFNQWLDRAGAPRLTLDEVEKTPRGDGSWELSFMVQQPAPGYRVAVDVKVMAGDSHVTSRQAVAGTETAITLQLAAEPEEIALDPDFHLFRHLSPDEAPPILRDTLLSSQVQVLALGDARFRQQALDLAQAMSDGPIEPIDRLAEPSAPFILLATASEADRFLQERGLEAMPDTLSVESSAQVWAGKTATGRTYVVVRVADHQALAALQRPLPHYGRKSYLAFAGSQQVLQGVWPATSAGIRYRFRQR